jgi:hypothetical protein
MEKKAAGVIAPLVRLRNDADGKIWKRFTAASREVSNIEEIIVGRVALSVLCEGHIETNA